MDSETIPSTAMTIDGDSLDALPTSFIRSEIFQIVMQVLASTTTFYNDKFTALPDELTFIINHTSTSLHNISITEETVMNNNSLAIHSHTVFTNITSEQIQQYMSHTKFISIIVIGSIFAILTTGGNLMVMVSFKIDKQLQTVSNYFLFSLAVADIAIGLVSIPVMTYYMAANSKWGLGYSMCQFWLCLDYMMCNASVLNLLLISLDRYFSVTKPLTYRPRRTAKKAFLMIASTYIASALLWPPWIISWPYIEGEFTETNHCVVQFIETNQFASVGTTIAAFWLPLVIMIILYSRVYCVTKKQRKNMLSLQAGQNQHGKFKKDIQSSVSYSSLRGRLTTNSSTLDSNKIKGSRTSCIKSSSAKGQQKGTDGLQISADEGSTTSTNYNHYYCAQNRFKRSPPISPLQNNQGIEKLLPKSMPSLSGNRTIQKNKPSTLFSTYTVLIELKRGEQKHPCIRLSSCESEDTSGSQSFEPDRTEEIVQKNQAAPSSLLQQQVFNGTALTGNLLTQQRKNEKERRKNERKQESKAAKTLSAILLAFILTWTPYNVIVCWEAFYKNSIPEEFFYIAYFLCYINSTINPFCYAFCNPRFRLTYMRILTGQWKRQQSSLANRAFFSRS